MSSKKVLREGPIPASMVGEVVAKHESKTHLGAHQIFLGTVRSDAMEDKEVIALEYSAYKEMAEKEFSRIREDAFEKYDLGCLHIYHSLGLVKAGEISLFVMLSAGHRTDVSKACKEIVEEIKKKVPIWKQEHFSDGSTRWTGEASEKEISHA